MTSGRAQGNWRAAIWALAGVMLCACATPPSGASSSSNNAPAPRAPKRATLAMRGNSPGFYYNETVAGGKVPGSDGLQDLVVAGLATMSDQGDWRPVLAEGVPTVENGQWKVFPDGQMEMTWTLRPNARWHDGVPVTADDFVFTIQVVTDKEFPEFSDQALNFLDGVEARDARTIVAHWKVSYIWADRLFTTSYLKYIAMPLPKHLLGDAYNENKSTFRGLPYWNQEFVSTGPFKVRDFVPGNSALLVANDQYALGRPKIDEIEVKFIPDSNAIVVNMLSGVVDLTLGTTVSIEQAVDAQKQGSLRAEGTPFNLQRMYPQLLDPRPAVLADVRFRRALLQAINRQELIDTLEAGLTVVPRSILPPSEVLYRAAEDGVPQYAYDPQRARQLIEDLGYARGPDGTILTPSGERLASIEIWGLVGDDNQAKVLFAVTDYWRRLGLAVDPIQNTQQQNLDRAYKANRPAFALQGGPNGLDALASMVTREIPRPETNYVGGNASRYVSPEYDALYERFGTTIPQAERIQVVGELLQHFLTNLPILPLYYRVEARLVANRLINVTPRSFGSSPAWDAHLWEVQ